MADQDVWLLSKNCDWQDHDKNASIAVVVRSMPSQSEHVAIAERTSKRVATIIETQTNNEAIRCGDGQGSDATKRPSYLTYYS